MMNGSSRDKQQTIVRTGSRQRRATDAKMILPSRGSTDNSTNRVASIVTYVRIQVFCQSLIFKMLNVITFCISSRAPICCRMSMACCTVVVGGESGRLQKNSRNRIWGGRRKRANKHTSVNWTRVISGTVKS